MKFLVTGGAGYIGSHMVRSIQEKGHEVIVLDNFLTGHRWAIKNCEVLNVDLTNLESLENNLKGRFFDCVFHFAGVSLVSESIDNPIKYFINNITGTTNLLSVMIKNDIKNIVFSSTAAVYGEPKNNLINEEDLKSPINPYGLSKLSIENILESLASMGLINSISLRYFNACGAHSSGDIGESHDPETHLIPNILKAIILNKKFEIFGNDFETEDGTAIRDYVHVEDIIDAHFLAYEYLVKNKGYEYFNLGSNKGYSVLEILRSCENISKKHVNFEITNRRAGDPSILVANSSKASEMLKWFPKRDLEKIIKSAWNWHSNHDL
jgi:UDP-glucose 4-epimerase